VDAAFARRAGLIPGNFRIATTSFDFPARYLDGNACWMTMDGNSIRSPAHVIFQLI
jgi:hypothetical protein